MVETEEAATEGRTGQPAQWARQWKMYHKRRVPRVCGTYGSLHQGQVYICR